MHDDVNINIVDDFSITGDVFMSFNHRETTSGLRPPDTPTMTAAAAPSA